MVRARILIGRETERHATSYYCALLIDDTFKDRAKYDRGSKPPFEGYRQKAEDYAKMIKDAKITNPREDIEVVNGRRPKNNDLPASDVIDCSKVPQALEAHIMGSLQEFMDLKNPQ